MSSPGKVTGSLVTDKASFEPAAHAAAEKTHMSSIHDDDHEEKAAVTAAGAADLESRIDMDVLRAMDMVEDMVTATLPSLQRTLEDMFGTAQIVLSVLQEVSYRQQQQAMATSHIQLHKYDDDDDLNPQPATLVKKKLSSSNDAPHLSPSSIKLSEIDNKKQEEQEEPAPAGAASADESDQYPHIDPEQRLFGPRPRPAHMQDILTWWNRVHSYRPSGPDDGVDDQQHPDVDGVTSYAYEKEEKEEDQGPEEVPQVLAPQPRRPLPLPLTLLPHNRDSSTNVDVSATTKSVSSCGTQTASSPGVNSFNVFGSPDLAKVYRDAVAQQQQQPQPQVLLSDIENDEDDDDDDEDQKRQHQPQKEQKQEENKSSSTGSPFGAVVDLVELVGQFIKARERSLPTGLVATPDSSHSTKTLPKTSQWQPEFAATTPTPHTVRRVVDVAGDAVVVQLKPEEEPTVDKQQTPSPAKGTPSPAKSTPSPANSLKRKKKARPSSSPVVPSAVARNNENARPSVSPPLGTSETRSIDVAGAGGGSSRSKSEAQEAYVAKLARFGAFLHQQRSDWWGSLGSGADVDAGGLNGWTQAEVEDMLRCEFPGGYLPRKTVHDLTAAAVNKSAVK